MLRLLRLGVLLGLLVMALAFTGVALGAPGDFDEDTFADTSDNCPNRFNPDQFDDDADGTGNSCDLTPGIAADRDFFIEYYRTETGAPVPGCVTWNAQAFFGTILAGESNGCGPWGFGELRPGQHTVVTQVAPPQGCTGGFTSRTFAYGTGGTWTASDIIYNCSGGPLPGVCQGNASNIEYRGESYPDMRVLMDVTWCYTGTEARVLPGGVSFEYDLIEEGQSALEWLTSVAAKQLFPLQIKRSTNGAVSVNVLPESDGSKIVSATAAFDICGSFPSGKLVKLLGKKKLDPNSNDPGTVKLAILGEIDSLRAKLLKTDSSLVPVLAIYESWVQSITQIADLLTEKCFSMWTPEIILQLNPNGSVVNVSDVDTNPAVPVTLVNYAP